MSKDDEESIYLGFDKETGEAKIVDEEMVVSIVFEDVKERDEFIEVLKSNILGTERFKQFYKEFLEGEN